MHEIRVRNDYMGVLAGGPVSSISTDSRFGTLVGTNSTIRILGCGQSTLQGDAKVTVEPSYGRGISILIET